MKNGFSLVELIITVSVIATLTTFGSVSYANIFRRDVITSDQLLVVSAIRKAQLYSLEAKNGGEWGVCSNANELIIFRGTCEAPIVSESFNLSSTLTGLSSPIMFNAYGEPESGLDLTLTLNSFSKNVLVNEVGQVSY